MMKILIYGAGVQGTYLAHALASNKNNEVTLLARGKTAENLSENGVIIRHYFQRKTTVDKIRIITNLEPNDEYNLIFVTMQYTHFPHVLDTLAKNVSPNIILVGNNLTAHDMQDYLQQNSLVAKNIGFGFQTTGGIRESKQTVCIRFGKGQMLIGSLNGDFPFRSLLDKAFHATPYKWVHEQQMDDWLKSHAVTVIAFGYVNFIHDNDFKKIARDKKLLKHMIEAVNEGFTALEHAGYPPIPAAQAKLVKQHKLFAYLFFKTYYHLPMAKFVDSSLAEVSDLFEIFAKDFLRADSTGYFHDLVNLSLDSNKSRK